jgi:hypothetical protein
MTHSNKTLQPLATVDRFSVVPNSFYTTAAALSVPSSILLLSLTLAVGILLIDRLFPIRKN